MYKEKALDVTGFLGEPVPNRFTQQEAETGTLAVVLPGIGYHADLPLLYYPAQVVLNKGMDLLRLETAYSRRPEFTRLSNPEQIAWLDADTDAIVDAALSCRSYRQVIFIGKSLGTMAMGHLLERGEKLPASRWVWLTPVLTDTRLIHQARKRRPRSLFAIGTADRYYDPQLLNSLVDSTQGKLVVIENANHSLEIPGSTHQSILALEQVVGAIEDFIQAA